MRHAPVVIVVEDAQSDIRATTNVRHEWTSLAMIPQDDITGSSPSVVQQTDAAAAAAVGCEKHGAAAVVRQQSSYRPTSANAARTTSVCSRAVADVADICPPPRTSDSPHPEIPTQ